MANQHHYYFIRYPLGAGGAHLANIMSLDPGFAPKLGAHRDGYHTAMKQHYSQRSDNTAHPPGHYLISDPRAPDALATVTSYQRSVHLGHAASFVWAESLLMTLPHKRYVLLQFNNESSREYLRNREKKIFGTDTLANDYYAAELACVYNQWFSAADACDDDINLAIECDQLLDHDISSVVGVINDKFHINIPCDQAQELHSVWMASIK
jgi:hypothetical protein